MAQSFREALRSDRFIVTSEAGPPKGTNLQTFKHHVGILAGCVDAVNVTDHQSSVMRFPSLGGCLLVKEAGGEPILQMTCRDRNRMALQAEVLFAHTRGVRNILCLTGDSVTVGDHKEAKGVFDLDSSQLLWAIRRMEKGKDLGGNDLDGAVEICAGAIVTPAAAPLEPQLIKFEKKIAAGAEFIQTQAVYDLEQFAELMEYARPFGVKILAGIILLTSAPMARFMNKNVPGVFVPQPLVDEMSVGKGKKKEALEKGIEIAGRMIRTLRDEKLCHGVHVMAIGHEDKVPRILEAAGMNGAPA